MENVLKLDRVEQYNDLVHYPTLHPLVSVIDFSQCPLCERVRFCVGFYTVFLKDVKCGDIQYGRRTYDYQEGTLVFLAPGQCVGFDNRGVKLREALHLSEQERAHDPRLPAQHPPRVAARHRPPQPHARREQHRDVPQLLRALLRPPVHHAQRRRERIFWRAFERTLDDYFSPTNPRPKGCLPCSTARRSSTCRPTTSATWSNA